MDHRPVQGIEYYSGWEKTLDKKLAVRERSRGNARIFCFMFKKGRWRDWTPYRRPLSRAEATARVDAAMKEKGEIRRQL